HEDGGHHARRMLMRYAHQAQMAVMDIAHRRDTRDLRFLLEAPAQLFDRCDDFHAHLSTTETRSARKEARTPEPTAKTPRKSRTEATPSATHCDGFHSQFLALLAPWRFTIRLGSSLRSPRLRG